jgi:hypothetical protein
MADLKKVVVQLRKERDEAQKRLEQLDQALGALGSLDGYSARQRPSKIGKGTEDYVSRSPKENRSGPTRALGKMESCQAEQINGGFAI